MSKRKPNEPKCFQNLLQKIEEELERQGANSTSISTEDANQRRLTGINNILDWELHNLNNKQVKSILGYLLKYGWGGWI